MKPWLSPLFIAVALIFGGVYTYKTIAPLRAEIRQADEEVAMNRLLVATLDTLNASATESRTAFDQINTILKSNNDRFIILGIVTSSPVATFADTYGILPSRLVASPDKVMATPTANRKYCFTFTRNAELSAPGYISLNLTIYSSADNFHIPIKKFTTAMVNRG